MAVYGYVGLCMAMYVWLVWLCMAIYGYVGLYRPVYGSLWLCGAVYGLCMAM